MTTHSTKVEIYALIDQIPEDVLDDVLEYLRTLTGKSEDKVRLSQNLSKILKEDKSLLQRLAQ